MNFKNVSFLKSVSIKSEDFDEMTLANTRKQKKEVIFVGRSNVGKSTIMNSLFAKKDLVKTSSKPGKTKLANLFSVDDKYIFTDLPGYGFAKVSKEMMEELDALISWYLEVRKPFISMVVVLIDSKIGPTNKDIDMYKYLLELELPVCIVLSKIDKLSKNEVNKSLNFSKKEFFGQEIFPVSSIKNTGLREFEKFLKASLLK